MGGAPRWRIFHPSDFSPGSAVAFAHALRLALVTGGVLAIMHVAPQAGQAHWTDFPGVRDTLRRWGLLPARSPRAAVLDLGIDVQKILAVDRDPVRSIRHHLDGHPADVVVLATHQHTGLGRWRHRAVAEPVARESGALTLFVPAGSAGFVDLETGAVRLPHVLVPFDHQPSPQPAVDGAAGLAAALGAATRFTALHVGTGQAPVIALPPSRRGAWRILTRPGAPVAEILRAAAEMDCALVVMTTEGRAGVLDALRGTTTERVVRGARCPVLAIPAGTRRLAAMVAGAA